MTFVSNHLRRLIFCAAGSSSKGRRLPVNAQKNTEYICRTWRCDIAGASPFLQTTASLDRPCTIVDNVVIGFHVEYFIPGVVCYQIVPIA